MTQELEIITWIVGQIVVAAAIWGAIRADIRGMHQRLDDLKEAVDHAHARLDNHLEMRRRSTDSC